MWKSHCTTKKWKGHLKSNHIKSDSQRNKKQMSSSILLTATTESRREQYNICKVENICHHKLSLKEEAKIKMMMERFYDVIINFH